MPLRAVVQRGGETGVFVVENGVASFRRLTTGIIGGLQIEVDGVPEARRSSCPGRFRRCAKMTDGTRVRQRAATQ
ncbi:MAG: hypothetical protein R2708_27985 [Vicinamibacterales bacterium]